MLTKCSDKGGKSPTAILRYYIRIPQRRIATWAVFCWMMMLGSSLWAQSSKEYIYLNGKVITSASADHGHLIPTCFQFSGTHGTQGFIGIDNITMSVCNGAGMSVTFRYSFTPWGTNNIEDYEYTIGPLNSAGNATYVLSHLNPAGLLEVTAIKNASGNDWVQVSPPAKYLVRPAKPKSRTYFDPTTWAITTTPSSQSLYAPNMKNQTIRIEEVISPWTSHTDEKYLQPYSGDDGYLTETLSCSSPNYPMTGTHNLSRARNALDDLDDDAWVLWNALDPGNPGNYTVTRTCP
jgi:hypothetical protein